METHECLTQDCTKVTPYPRVQMTLVTWTRRYEGERGLENFVQSLKFTTKTISVSRCQ